jgi:hypothetical protein
MTESTYKNPEYPNPFTNGLIGYWLILIFLYLNYEFNFLQEWTVSMCICLLLSISVLISTQYLPVFPENSVRILLA